VLVLQGNAATKLRCGGKFLILVISYILLILTVTEFLKSTYICQSYSKNKRGTVFLTHSVVFRLLPAVSTARRFVHSAIFWTISFIAKVLTEILSRCPILSVFGSTVVFTSQCLYHFNTGDLAVTLFHTDPDFCLSRATGADVSLSSINQSINQSISVFINGSK